MYGGFDSWRRTRELRGGKKKNQKKEGDKMSYEEFYSYTFGGQKIYYLRPDLATISITEIAHALSLINRFTGQTSWPYSVAQHSFILSLLVSDENKLDALLHDAAECYLGDVASPLKRLLNGTYTDLEAIWNEEIRKKFNLPMCESEEVEEKDHLLTEYELKYFIKSDHPVDFIPNVSEKFFDYYDFKYMTGLFLDRFYRLRRN